MASQSTSLTIVYSTVYSGADQRKHQSSVLLAICAGNSPITGEFPAQMASNAENVSIWWRHHAKESAVSSRCDPCYTLAVGVICLIVRRVVGNTKATLAYHRKVMTNVSKVAIDCAVVTLAMVDWQSIVYCVMLDVPTNNYRTLKEYAHGSRLLFVFLVPTPLCESVGSISN